MASELAVELAKEIRETLRYAWCDEPSVSEVLDVLGPYASFSITDASGAKHLIRVYDAS